MLRSVVVALAVSLAAAGSAAAQGGAAAQGSADALAWLQKMYSATQKLNYAGTFIYQYGDHSETSRVTRLVENGNVYERVETLDGVPREVVRVNDEVKWYLPTASVVKIDRNQVAKPFPGMLPDKIQSLGAYYNVRKGEVERIAGYDCQSIVLEPRDGMRYAHKLWADTATGMLVKAKTFNEKGEPLEQFFFTDLRIGGRIDRDAVRSKYAAKAAGWRVENLVMNEANLAEAGWMMKALPPGYAKVTEMRGTFGATPSVAHIVLSDGLAAASVFIEPLAGRQPPAQLGPSRKGAMNVYTRRVDDALVTVVGEMPAEGVRFIANQVEYRKPN
jgi:sigma-E factor negative regulatory protein RseB